MRRLPASWLLSLTLAACSTGAVDTPPVSSKIGVSGGDVKNADNNGVSIPSGALGTDANITVTSTPDAPPPSTAMPVGTPVTFGPEGQQFLKPVTVTISFDPAQLPSGKTASQLAIFTAPAGTTAYTQLATTVVDATHLSAQVMHFSTFVAALPTACAVSCGASASQGCATAPAVDGGSTSTGQDGGACPPPMMGCDCYAYCNADGTPAPAPQPCSGTVTVDAGTSSGGSGGSSDGGPPPPTGDSGSCPPPSGNSYAVRCTQDGCVCMLNNVAMATLPAINCQADPSTFISQYTACGFPGVYVPPPPPGTGGTPSADGGISSGGGGSDGGTTTIVDAGTQSPPDFGGGGVPDLSPAPGDPGAPCTMSTDCKSGMCGANMTCK